MGSMESLESEPRRYQRQSLVSRQLHEQVPGFLKAFVIVSSFRPFVADRLLIAHECEFIPSPHLCDGVIHPPLTSHERFHDLKRFDSLLAEALTIEYSGRLLEAAVREESLH